MRENSYRSNNSGVVGIAFAIVLIPLLLMVGLAIDFGRAYSTRSRLQDCSDAAALAGARQYTSSQELPGAITLATDMLQRGFYPNGYKHQRQFKWNISGEETPEGNVLTVKAEYKLDTYFVKILPKYKQLDIKVTSKAIVAGSSFDEGKLTVTIDKTFNNSQFATGILNVMLLPSGATSATTPKDSAIIMRLGPNQPTEQGGVKKVFENAEEDDVIAFKIPNLVRSNQGRLIMNTYCRLPDFMFRNAASNPEFCPQQTVFDLSQPYPQRSAYSNVGLLQNTEVWMKQSDSTQDSLYHFPADYRFTWGKGSYTTKYGALSQVWGFPELTKDNRFVKCPKAGSTTKPIYRIYYLYFGDVDPTIPTASYKLYPETVNAAFRVTCAYGSKGSSKGQVPHLIQ